MIVAGISGTTTDSSAVGAGVDVAMAIGIGVTAAGVVVGDGFGAGVVTRNAPAPTATRTIARAASVPADDRRRPTRVTGRRTRSGPVGSVIEREPHRHRV